MVNYTKIKTLSKAQGISFAHINRLLNKSAEYLRNCADHKINLSPEQIAIIANALHTTPEYLTDLTDDPKIEKAPADIDGRKREIIELFNSLSENQQAQAIDFLNFLKSQEKH